MDWSCGSCDATFNKVRDLEIHLNKKSHSLNSLVSVRITRVVNVLNDNLQCPVCLSSCSFSTIKNHFLIHHTTRYQIGIQNWCDLCNKFIASFESEHHINRQCCRRRGSSDTSSSQSSSPPRSPSILSLAPDSPNSLTILSETEFDDDIILTQGDPPELLSQPNNAQRLQDVISYVCNNTNCNTPPPSSPIFTFETTPPINSPTISPTISEPPSPPPINPESLEGTKRLRNLQALLAPTPPSPILEDLPVDDTAGHALPSRTSNSPPTVIDGDPISNSPISQHPQPLDPPSDDDMPPPDNTPNTNSLPGITRPDVAKSNNPADPDIHCNPNPDVEDMPPFPKEWFDRITSTESFEEFEDMCEKFAEAAREEGRTRATHRSTKPKPKPTNRPAYKPPNNNRRRLRFNPIEARRIQTFYRLSKKRAMRTVIKENNTYFTGSTEDATSYFNEVHNTKTSDIAKLEEALQNLVPKAKPDDLFVEPFPQQLVSQKLHAMANSAPGRDKLEYNHLKLVDPEALVLQAIFNKCLSSQRVPSVWKQATTVLIHKKGSSDDPSNFRPIALMSCLYKLYASLLSTRISSFAHEENLISPNQKSARPGEGCHEHTFLLQSLIADSKRNSKNVFLAWLDLRNAFGSVPHDAIYSTLKHMGFPDSLITIIKDIYTNAVTSVKTGRDETTPDIPILAGVKQGCPLSAILFNLTAELLVRAVLHVAKESPSLPYSFHQQKISVLAYADDLVIISRTREGLQTFLDTISEAADILSLEFRQDKCCSLSATCNKREPSRIGDTSFIVQGSTIPVLNEHESYRYLGVPVSLIYNNTDMDGIIARLTRDLAKIRDSLLAPWQKLDAIRTFIQPCLTYILRAYPVLQTSLVSYRKILLSTLRSICHLPKRSATSYFFASRRAGGLGLQDPFDERHVQTIVQTVKMLSSTDELVSAISRAQLTSCARRCVRHDPSPDEVDAYLSGSTDGLFANHQSSNNSRTLWSRARMSARALGVKFVNAISDDPSFSADGSTQIKAKGSSYQLHLICQAKHAETLKAKRDQGKVARALDVDKFATGSAWHYDGLGMRFCDWRFIHRARTNTLPLNANKSRWSDTNPACRRCHGPQSAETLPHVLCHCRPNMVAIRDRHNKIATRLANAIYRGEKSVDLSVPESGTNLRPDIVVRDGNRVTIIDVTCPFENEETALQDAALRKIEKYSQLIKDFQDNGKEAKVFPFVVGALGAWYPENELLLNELRISNRYRRLFRKLCSADAIQGSRDIYMSHLINGRQ